jgi:hypothetical protein
MTQAQLDWYASLLKNPPCDNTFQAIDRPDWQDVNLTPFDSSMYSGLRGALGEAYA